MRNPSQVLFSDATILIFGVLYEIVINIDAPKRRVIFDVDVVVMAPILSRLGYCRGVLDKPESAPQRLIYYLHGFV